MIDVAAGSAVYYYHYDGSGSVVALSNSSGNSTLGTSCQSYVYSAFGRVWAEYPEFKANPYMFTGRRFDYETGLYYYRARYYNPYIGRFLQTDPIGYGDGINWYAYCGNNPICCIDPTGLADFFYDGRTGEVTELTGEWNLYGIGAIFNVDPCNIEIFDCGEDTIYACDETAEYIRYRYDLLPEGTEVLAGTSLGFNGTESTTSVVQNSRSGDSVQWITGQFLASFTGSFYRASGLIWDSYGNVGWINITGGGGGTPSFQVGLGAGSVNASNINAVNGAGGQGGGSVGPALVSAGTDIVCGENYVGTEASVTAGFQPIVEGHGILTHATVYPLFNTTGTIIKFLDIFIDNPYD